MHCVELEAAVSTWQLRKRQFKGQELAQAKSAKKRCQI
jgi:hypothetical protein